MRVRDTLAFHFALIFGGGILGVVALVLAIAVATSPLERASCNVRWPDVEHRYSIMGDCQIKTKSGWIPEKNYREVP